MGSTGQSTSLTPSTQILGITQGAPLTMKAVTSSGVYFSVGDMSKTIIYVVNASSSDTGAVWVDPGSTSWAGSGGRAPSTGSTVYSTAAAGIAITLPSPDITGSSAITSTETYASIIGPFDSDKYKSSDGLVFLVASTGSTKVYAAVYQMVGGSTN